jgi:hypothetical protein
MEEQTTADGPKTKNVLLDPFNRNSEPRPVPGCDVCGDYMRLWRQATEPNGQAHDPSHATDLAVMIGRHPHEDLVKGRR